MPWYDSVSDPEYGTGLWGVGIYGGAIDREEAVNVLAASTEYNAFDSVRDRLDAYLKPAFNHDPANGGEEWNAYLGALSSEFNDFYMVRNDVLAAQYVETAEGAQLDRIGEYAQLDRRTGESDAHYRQRLIVQMQQFVAGGTIDDIKSICAVLLETQKREIEIVENFGIEPARFDIQVPLTFIENAGVTPSEFEENVSDAAAAGVRPVITTTGSFEYRSYEDYQNGINTPEKGYDGFDADGNPRGIGGEYAGYLSTES